MREINLLDWRREVRDGKKKKFLVAVGVALLGAAAVVGGVHKHYADRISYQQSRNALLTQEIATLDRQIKEIQSLESERERLIARTDKIQQLQAGRSDIVHLVDDMVTTLPSGVYYTSIRQQGAKLTMEGRAQSNARVSTLMRQLNSSEYMDDAVLQEIRSQSSQSAAVPRTSAFQLSVRQTNSAAKPSADEG